MITLTDDNFEKEVLESKKPVLVDFWALGCHPCTLMEPIFEKLANHYGEKAVFARANVQLTPLTSQKYGIEAIPTVILFKEGKAIGGFVGLRSEPDIEKWLEESLK